MRIEFNKKMIVVPECFEKGVYPANSLHGEQLHCILEYWCERRQVCKWSCLTFGRELPELNVRIAHG